MPRVVLPWKCLFSVFVVLVVWVIAVLLLAAVVVVVPTIKPAVTFVGRLVAAVVCRNAIEEFDFANNYCWYLPQQMMTMMASWLRLVAITV